MPIGTEAQPAAVRVLGLFDSNVLFARPTSAPLV